MRKQLFWVAVVLMVTTGNAVDAQICDDYASRAASQNNYNISRKCGFAGDLWNSNPAYHRAWCLRDNNETLINTRLKERELALENDCITGTGDLSAYSWCYEIHENGGMGGTVRITFSPIIKNVGDRDWYSNKDGTYYVMASFGSESVNKHSATLPGFPNWSIDRGMSKQLESVSVPFHENNYYAHGWGFLHSDDDNPNNDSLRLQSIGLGRRFLPNGDLAYMRCHNQQETNWADLPPTMVSSTSPAIATFDGRVFLVAVEDNGTVNFNSTNGLGNWNTWQALSGVAAEPLTAPLMVHDRDANTLHLFVRDKGNNLFRIQRQRGGGWSGWQQITAGSEVRGRFSVVATGTAEPNPVFHTLFRSQSIGGLPIVAYRRYNYAMNTILNSDTRRGFIEGVLGTDSANEVIQVLRATRGIGIYLSTPPWAAWQDVTPNAIATNNPNVLRSLDISNIVFFGDGFHFGYTSEQWAEDFAGESRGQVLQHIRIQPAVPASFNATIIASSVQSESIMRAAIEKYRNKLVFAYNEPDWTIQYARLDNADPLMPWISTKLVSTDYKSVHRVALTAANFRDSSTNYDVPNFGNDLFAAITNSIASDRLAFLNFSRQIFLTENELQFKVYNSQSGASNCHQDGKTRSGLPCNAPYFVPNIWEVGRPYMSELGYFQWILPHWFVKESFGDIAFIKCEEEDPSGRFEKPCTGSRYPIILIPMGTTGNAHITSGAWVYGSSAVEFDFFHELMHATLTTRLGLQDSDSAAPNENNERLARIPLLALKEAYDIFGERLNYVGPGPRETGFVNYSGENYDTSSRQHSFEGALYSYFSEGNLFRNWISIDLAAGDTLLQRKYNWIRQFIFRGVEFGDNNEPL